MATTVIALIAGAVVHYLYGGIRLQVTHDRLSEAAQAHLSVLLGVFVLAKGLDYYLDRFDLVNESGRLITGMTYTDENAVLPAKNILMGVAVICAVLFFLNVWRRTWQLPSVGLALLALSSILLGMIWPGIVQQFQVKPSEPDKEASYIKANIDATRSGLRPRPTSTCEPYSANATISDTSAGALAARTASVPLVDPLQVQQAFEQLQQGRAYYTVADVLDVDRYEIGGSDRALVLGVRELDQSGIAEGEQNWSNLHTVYTHGNGIIAAYANARPFDESQGQETGGSNDGILWAEGNREDDLSGALGGFEQRVYYGEEGPEYSIVGKAEEDDPDVELNLPTAADEDAPTTTTYDGDGGVGIGGFFNQLMYAVKFGEANFLLAGRVNENSKVLYVRNPQERVEKVAPWLTTDSDPYPAVVDDRIQWIIDGYTTTDRYPLSQRESFDTMTSDSLDTGGGLRALPTDEINYMRNAVKATVDAYDGTVRIYEWDTEDPLLEAWSSAFPGTVQPREDIPEELLEHLRYPEDLFKVQRYQFARYHVTDADDFYQSNNRWEVPEDPFAAGRLQPPYRLFVDDPLTTEVDEDFSLTSVFVPFDKDNLASFMSVSSDATDEESYGRIQVLELPNELTDGPGQVANDFSSDEGIRQALLALQTGGAQRVDGNLLTLPIDDGLMYVQPIYIRREFSDASFPILQYVQVQYGDRVGGGQTLLEALSDLLGVDPGEVPEDPEPTDEPTDDPTGSPSPTEDPEPTGSINAQIRALLVEADTAFTAAQTALEAGNLGQYQRQLTKAQDLVAEALALADQRDANGG